MKQLVILLFFPLFCISQNLTKVKFKLSSTTVNELEVRVYAPEKLNEFEFVVPQITPGTYMKINYVKFYSDFAAFDSAGNEMKVTRKDNVFKIKGKLPLKFLKYKVKQSLGNRKFWDNTLACAGTVLTSKSALLNFQLVNGYFEKYKNQPFEVEVIKPKTYYGASSINKQIINDTTDILRVENYGELIDQPILYAVADTTSFVVNGHKFNIAVHSETGNNTALNLKPGFEKIMQSISDFSGFTSKKDYSFILYFIDEDRLKGLVKTFGAGSALEHKHSSVYYDIDTPTNNFNFYNYIVSHEYYHTLTPLSFHSKKIENFNFRTPDMSKHVWLYEGVTDYLAFLLNAKSLSKNPYHDLSWAISSSLKHKKQSMTHSSEHIIRKKNIISWLTKIGEIGNFYEKGKLIALGLDMAIMEQSNGEKRLVDVLYKLNEDYKNNAFTEDELKEILIAEGIPDMKNFYEKYIEGTKIPPYQEYLNRLGYTYYPEKSKLPSYGIFAVRKGEKDTTMYYVNWAKKNSLGLVKGDTLLKINDTNAYQFIKTTGAYRNTVLNPEITDKLTLTIQRNGTTKTVTASPEYQKIKYARVVELNNCTEEQKNYREKFFGQE